MKKSRDMFSVKAFSIWVYKTIKENINNKA